MLNLTNWDLITPAERLARCADLTTTVPMAGPALVAVTLLIGIPLGLQRGQVLGVTAAEASALRAAGFAS